MTFILTAILIAGVTFGSGMGALHVQRFLPELMRSDSCRTVIVQVSALLSVLLAMVLGGLVGTSFSFFFAQKSNMDTLSAQVLQLDRALAEYGPEASGARAQLKENVLQGFEVFWSIDRSIQGRSQRSLVRWRKRRHQCRSRVTPAEIGSAEAGPSKGPAICYGYAPVATVAVSSRSQVLWCPGSSS